MSQARAERRRRARAAARPPMPPAPAGMSPLGRRLLARMGAGWMPTKADIDAYGPRLTLADGNALLAFWRGKAAEQAARVDAKAHMAAALGMPREAAIYLDIARKSAALAEGRPRPAETESEG
jgi:hypothetical protein